jgi:hypothetical protein
MATAESVSGWKIHRLHMSCFSKPNNILGISDGFSANFRLTHFHFIACNYAG